METKAGYVVGWRAWRVLPPGYLVDMNMRSVWEPGEALPAFCFASSARNWHLAPVVNCVCGYYAYTYPGPARRHGMLYGPVALWGRVITHDTGYRAEFAYPLGILDGTPELFPSDVIESIGVRYGIPINKGLLTSQYSDPRTTLSNDAMIQLYHQHKDRELAYEIDLRRQKQAEVQAQRAARRRRQRTVPTREELAEISKWKRYMRTYGGSTS